MLLKNGCVLDFRVTNRTESQQISQNAFMQRLLLVSLNAQIGSIFFNTIIIMIELFFLVVCLIAYGSCLILSTAYIEISDYTKSNNFENALHQFTNDDNAVTRLSHKFSNTECTYRCIFIC